MVKSPGFDRRQRNRLLTPAFGRQVKHLRLAAMGSTAGQTPPNSSNCEAPWPAIGVLLAFAPMALTVTLFKQALIPGNGVVHGRKQQEQLSRTAVLHRRTGEQPDRPEAGMPGQSQQGRRAGSLKRLGEMGLINHQECSSWRQLRQQPGPAHQLQGQIQSGGLPLPVEIPTRPRRPSSAAHCITSTPLP